MKAKKKKPHKVVHAPPIEPQGAEGPSTTREHWDTARIHPRNGNPRTHTDAQVAQIATLIEEFGFTTDLLIEPDGTLIAGEGRWRAAQSLKLAQVPVRIAHGWTPAQVRAYVIADNQVAANAGWDADLLKLELQALTEADFDTELLGFTGQELEKWSGESAQNGDSEGPEEPAPQVSRRGDVWLCGSHRLIVGRTKPNHADGIVRQWQAMTRRSAKRESDGLTFAQAEENART